MKPERVRAPQRSPNFETSKSTMASPAAEPPVVKIWNGPLPDDLLEGANPSTSDGQADRSLSLAKSANNGWPIWRPLLVALLFSLFVRVTDLDRKISSLNYNVAQNEWPFERAEPWLSFYRYGTIPPVLLGIAGAIVALSAPWLMRSASRTKTRAFQRGGLFLALMLAIGPGLLVNVWLKTIWGRPRPIQCSDFGGELTFLPIGEWAAISFHNSSFPSGHAAVAFFLMGLGFVIGPQYGRWQRVGFFGGLGYGLAMGFTRVLQGGHFVTDVLWAGMIVYLVGVALAWILLRPSPSATANPKS